MRRKGKERERLRIWMNMNMGETRKRYMMDKDPKNPTTKI